MRDENKLTMGSLFTGIGGIDLAFQQAGFGIAFQVEIDAFCQAVLAKNFPKVQKFGDIRNVRGADLPPVDVLAGGFPCQDISIAGKRKGINGEQSVLWKQFARIISEIRPRVVFVENVSHILRLGGTEVVGDLAAMGYDTEWAVISANAVGSPQKRERWFLVGYPHRVGQYGTPTTDDVSPDKERDDKTHAKKWGNVFHKPFADNVVAGSKEWDTDDESVCQSSMDRVLDGISFRVDGYKFPAHPGNLPHEWEPPRTIERGSDPHWAARMTALGNAVVPQVVYLFAVCIRKFLEGNQP